MRVDPGVCRGMARPLAAAALAAAPAAVSAVSTAGTAAAAARPRRGFRLVPDLVACLQRFNGLSVGTLQDFTEVQVQLGLGADKVK